MACQITVDRNESRGHRDSISGILQEIYLEGTLPLLQNAKNVNVEVTLTCGIYVLPPANALIGKKQQGGVQVWIWYHTYKNLPAACFCGGQVKVKAECDNGVEICENVDFDEPFDLICKDIPPTIPLPKCPSFISNKVDVSKECDAKGNRTVTVTQNLDSADKYSAELRLGNVVLDFTKFQGVPAQVSGPYPLTHTGDYPGNSNLNFAVIITYPNIGCGNSYIPVNLPPCKEEGVPPGGGAWIGNNHEWGECDEQGNRQVTISCSIHSQPPIDAEIRESGTGKILDKKTSNTTPLKLNATVLVKGGTKFSWDVITYKPFASKDTRVIDIPSCDKNGGGNGGGGACGSMVWVVGALLALGASLTALTLAWFLCVPGSVPPVWVWVSVIAIDVVAGLAIALWYIMCAFVPGCSCPTKCDWLQIGTMTAFASATILAWLSNCCPIWPLAAGFGAAYTGSLIAWITSCKPSKCVIFAANLTALVSGAIPAIGYIIWVPQIAACGSKLVSTIAATVAGILAAMTAAACASSSKKP